MSVVALDRIAVHAAIVMTWVRPAGQVLPPQALRSVIRL
jgi:hypothetical protein